MDDMNARCRRLRGHTDLVSAVGFIGNYRVVSGSWDHTLRLWDVGKTADSKIIAADQGVIVSIAVSSDGRLMLTGGQDGIVRFWDLQRMTLERVLGGFYTHGPRVAISHDGGYALVTDYIGMRSDITERETNTKPAVGGYVGPAVYLYNTRSGERSRIFTINSAKGYIDGAQFSLDGLRVMAVLPDDGVAVWDRISGELIARLRLCGDGANLVLSAALSDDSRRVLVGDMRGLHEYDIYDGREIIRREGNLFGGVGITSVEYAHGSRRALSAGGANSVWVWETQTWTVEKKLRGAGNALFPGLSEYITDARFAPDGRRIASGSSDRTVRICDVQ